MDEEEWVEEDDLGDYIEHVSAMGYALTALDRFLCFLRACGFAVCAIFTGFMAWLTASVTKDASASIGAFFGFGWVALVFTIAFGAVTLALVLAALSQLAAAFVGRESVQSRVARNRLGA